MPAALFGYAIDSDVPLTRTPEGPTHRGVLRVRAEGAEDLLARDGELASWHEEDGTAFVLALTGDAVLAWCSATGAYLVDPAAGEVLLRPHSPQPAWEHRLTSVMVPMLLGERGDLALHAATVSDGERAVVVCAQSGRGKSTLAGALGEAGYTVLSEDGSVLTAADGSVIAWPGPAGVRLSDAAARALGRAAPPALDGEDHELRRPLHDDVGTPATEPVPVAGIVVLDERGGEAVECERIEPAQALALMLHCALFAGPSRTAPALRAIAAVAERVPMHRARLPDDLSQVSSAAQELFATVRG